MNKDNLIYAIRRNADNDFGQRPSLLKNSIGNVKTSLRYNVTHGMYNKEQKGYSPGGYKPRVRTLDETNIELTKYFIHEIDLDNKENNRVFHLQLSDKDKWREINFGFYMNFHTNQVVNP